MVEYIDGLIEYLVQLTLELLLGIFYPVVCIIKIFINVFVYIWQSFVTLFGSFESLADSVYGYVVSYLTFCFPALWVTLLALGFLIVVILRIYWFAKDISIAGFKI